MTYQFIKVDNHERIDITNPKDRGVFRDIYKVTYELIALTHIHVGSGIKELYNDNILFRFSRSKGRPIIPGASIKGVVSTNFLALSGSAEKTSELFGTTKENPYISKIYFNDIKFKVTHLKIKPIEEAFKPKKQYKVVKYYPIGKILRKKVYYMETLDKGTLLYGNFIAYQIDDYELGGLIASLGRLRNNVNMGFKIGYGKWQAIDDNNVKTYGIVKLNRILIKKLFIENMNLKEKIIEDVEKYLNAFYSVPRFRGSAEQIARKYFIDPEAIS